MAEHFDILIIGGGPAGLTAALYARRAGKSVLVLEKAAVGGQIASSPRVENFPGILSVSGAELADRLYEQADRAGARIELEEVLEVRDGTPKTVVTDYGSYTCDALILATGMKHRSLGLPGEDTLSGISYCAVCDGAFYAGKDVAVAGGGNTAVQDALFLSELCRHVTVIHRRDTFRADPVLVDALKRREKHCHLFSGGSVADTGPEEDPEHDDEPNPAAGDRRRFVEPKGKQTDDVADSHYRCDAAAANLIGNLAGTNSGKRADNRAQPGKRDGTRSTLNTGKGMVAQQA